MDYNQTVHLPKTDFPMRAGLPKREPEMLQAFYDKDLYHKMMTRNEGKPQFILHDGPPYANGNIHIGHAMNKISKDMINRYWMMQGYEVPYVPGWDCHGQPIEHKVEEKLGTEKFNRPPRPRFVSSATSSLSRTSSSRRPASVVWACSATGTTPI